MILAFDVGNTNTTIGCIDNGQIKHVFKASTNIVKTADECAADIQGALRFLSLDCEKIDGAIISCVVPPLTLVFKAAVKQLTGVDAVIVGAGVKTGMNILIDDPAQLGGDMVATAVGALASYEPPMIVVDMGTATKMYVINRNGGFIGGAIAPGLALSMNALVTGTAQLPRVQIEAPLKCISTNTIDCMKSGAIFGAASMIDGLASRFEAELGEEAKTIITGGFADLVYNHCKRQMIHDPNLILVGLEIIYEKNRQNRQ